MLRELSFHCFNVLSLNGKFLKGYIRNPQPVVFFKFLHVIKSVLFCSLEFVHCVCLFDLLL